MNTPSREVVRSLIAETVELGYTAAVLGIPLPQAKADALAHSDRLVDIVVATVRQVGAS